MVVRISRSGRANNIAEHGCVRLGHDALKVVPNVLGGLSPFSRIVKLIVFDSFRGAQEEAPSRLGFAVTLLLSGPWAIG
jgi:hypothetical protein